MKYLLEKNKLNNKQIDTVNNILALGLDRPYSPNGLPEKIEKIIIEKTKNLLGKWNLSSLYFNKSSLSSISKCEGIVIANAEKKPSVMNSSIIIGNISHKAIQVSYTHKLNNVEEIISNITDNMKTSEKVEDIYFHGLDSVKQSEIISQATSRVTNFLDDWPPLQSIWSPRFEESLSYKCGKLLLSSRVDLVIGRPRSDGKRTLMLIDFKSGNINDEHQNEAMLYSLIATLRHKIMPWRSVVYSLSSGEYTELDHTGDDLLAFADTLSDSVNRTIETLLELRSVKLTPGDHCTWCPKSLVCLESTVKKIT